MVIVGDVRRTDSVLNALVSHVRDWRVSASIELRSPRKHTVQEKITLKNQAAIALLRSWLEEDPGNQQEEWERVKEVLEENRLSDRPLFP